MTTINEEVIQLISDQQIRKSLNFKEKVKFNRTGNNHFIYDCGYVFTAKFN
jgi:hypothetical protein